MPAVKVPLSTYQVTLSRQIEFIVGKQYAKGHTVVVDTAKCYAMIKCLASDGHEYMIYFIRPDSIVPNNYFNPKLKRGAAFLPYDLYPTYVDLLRNEQPVSIYLNPDKPEWNQLYTGSEPVGEGE